MPRRPFGCLLLFASSQLVSPLTAGQLTSDLSAESVAYVRQQLTRPGVTANEKLARYTRYDFGPLWRRTAEPAVVGFIGPHYQRLQVKVLTATKSSDASVYQLTGKTRVRGVVRAFRGTVRLQHVREVTLPVRPLAEYEGTAPSIAVAGLLVGRYELREDSTLSHTGVFRGVLVTSWYVDRKGQLHYNDSAQQVADGYHNNQYVGSWTAYAQPKALRCNWGDYRIANAGDLDIGAGDFSPAEKYYPNGWQSYAMASSTQQRPPQPWWK